MVPAWFPFPMGSLPLNRSTLINIYSSRFLEHLRCLLDYNSLRIPWDMQFQQYVTPDTGRKFTELYNVQHLQDNRFDSTSEVCITTIQRLYSILTGEPLEKEKEEELLFEQEDLSQDQEQKRRTVNYNPAVPIEYFDFSVNPSAECAINILSLKLCELTFFTSKSEQKKALSIFGLPERCIVRKIERRNDHEQVSNCS